MLVSLKITNYALIESLSLQFDSPYLGFIGPSGAGKSLIIESLTLLKGIKGDVSKIRKGESYLEVEGEFIASKFNEEKFISRFNDTKVLVSRKIDSKGRNTIKINHKVATLNELKEKFNDLIDFHSQISDSRYLASYDELLDFYINLKASVNEKNHFLEYKNNLKTYKENLKSIEELEEKKQDIGSLENLKNRIDELENLQIKEDEMEHLEEEKLNLQNFKKDLNDYQSFLSNFEEITSSLSSCKNAILRINDSEIEPLQNRFNESYYELIDIKNELENKYSSMQERIDYLQNIEERLYLLHSLRKRYGYSTKEILESLENLKEDYQDFSTLDSRLAELKEDNEILYQRLNDLSSNILHKIREKYSLSLEEEINSSLKRLGFFNSSFKVSLETSSSFLENGNDIVTFLLQANKGENYLPLAKSASLGESSRLNFALKYVFNKCIPPELIIFDEIDVGLSQEMGISLGKMMLELKDYSMIILISHLPSLTASLNDIYLVSKEVINDRTLTICKKAKKEEKVEIIASMISSSNGLEAANSLILQYQ